MDKTDGKQWSGKSRGGAIGYRLFAEIIDLLGLRTAYCILAIVVVYFILFAPKATASVWYYHRCIRHLSRMQALAALYNHYFVFGQTLIDRMAMRNGMAERFKYEFDNYNRFIDIINGEQGVIIIGAHVGCWEAGATFFGRYGKKTNIVMFDAEHQKIKDVLNENALHERNYKIIPINVDAIGAMVQIKVALNGGEYVCFNGDRYIDSSHTYATEFMGREALFPTGPFTIAAKCRVPVVFYYAMREKGNTYRFIFEEVRYDAKMTSETIIKQYIKSLESIAVRYPTQWFNFYKFWNKPNE